MRSISVVNLATVDLKLLVVFDAVMAEGSVTSAGERLGMTQPAVSNALGRLRHLLNDELFTRAQGRMRPTPRALELTGPVRHALKEIEAVLDPAGFDPARDIRVFKLAMSDHTALLVLPPLVKRLECEAPNVSLQVRPKSNETFAELLDAHEVDFALGVVPDAPLRLSRVTLFEDVLLCIMRTGHKLARGELTLKKFSAVRHIAVRPAGEKTNLADNLLESEGMQRRKAVTVNQFLGVPEIVESTDLVATMYRRTADRLGILRNPRLLTRPLPFPPVQAMLFWHSAMTHNKAHRWLREALVESCRVEVVDETREMVGVC
jgi:DNA-binding transcriptional LysR family regulator